MIAVETEREFPLCTQKIEAQGKLLPFQEEIKWEMRLLLRKNRDLSERDRFIAPF